MPASTSRPSTSAASAPGGNAIALIEVDQPVPSPLMEKIRALPHVVQCKSLRF